LLVAGCDPSVSILIAWMARTGSRINAVALPCSSGRALAALAAQSVHVAGLHMRDPRTGDYNRPQVRAVRAGRIRLINFSRWEVGLARARENPRGIRDFQDLANPNVRFINRERGAGARQALDEALAEAGINPIRLNGYRQEAGGHLEVAAAIAQGVADAGVTIRVVAQAYGLDFIPLREERSDLAIPEAEIDSTPVKGMLDALDSRRFAKRCPSSAATTPR
jgi:putative molybdopterin biosynthesis protein